MSDTAVYSLLDELGISYQRVDHPPVATVDEAEAHWAGIDAFHAKNLFLRNKKGDRHYLVVVGHRTPVDLKRLADLVGDDRLSFGSPERLQARLGLTPGAVSPFGLINDREHRVRVIIDAALREAGRVAFHPNVNTATIVLAREDFEKFLAWSGHPVRYVAIA